MEKLKNEGKMTPEQVKKMNKLFHKNPFKVREMLKNHLKKTNLGKRVQMNIKKS